MATNQILEKYASSTAVTITLASLASSTSLVGRLSTQVDNTTNKYTDLLIHVKTKQGTSPTGGRAVYVYVVNDDGAGNRDDGAGATDAGFTVLAMTPVLVLQNKATPATGDLLEGTVKIPDPPPKWSIVIVHDTGVNLDSTAGNHSITYVGFNRDIQAAA